MARSWKFSGQDPGGRGLHQQLRGGEVVVTTIPATSYEECLKDDDTTRITINIYLGPLLILKVAAAMIVSAMQKLRQVPSEAGLRVLRDSVEGVETSSQDHSGAEVDGAGQTTI